MAFVEWILQIAVEWEQLFRRQHTLVDDDVSGQRTDVKKMILRQAFVTTQAVG